MDTTRPHVLMVDDDDALLSAVEAALVDEGFRVTPHRDGYKALDWLYTNPLPDLLLLNMRLPTMDGWTFWSRLRFMRGASELPIVVVASEESLRDRVLTLGATGFLLKPFSLDQLVQEIRRALAAPRNPSPRGSFTFDQR